MSLRKETHSSSSSKRSLTTSCTDKENKKPLSFDINDFTCPICLDILIEPITTPCKHEMCLECFKSLKDDRRKFECPMCRAPCAVWATQIDAYGNRLVNHQRWLTIQAAFPQEVSNKREGKSPQLVIEAMDAYKKQLLAESTNQSDSNDEALVFAKPGELRSEYLELVRQEEEKIRRQREAEEKESLEAIRRMLQEEGHSLDTYINMVELGLHRNPQPNRVVGSSATNFNSFPVDNRSILPDTNENLAASRASSSRSVDRQDAPTTSSAACSSRDLSSSRETQAPSTSTQIARDLDGFQTPTIMTPSPSIEVLTNAGQESNVEINPRPATRRTYKRKTPILIINQDEEESSETKRTSRPRAAKMRKN